VEYTCELVEELIKEDRQVAVSVEYLGSLDAIRDNLEARGLKVAEFSGRNTSTRETERKAYQKGQRDILIFSTESSISLHKEGKTDKERAQVVHDLRWSGIEQEQIDGRSHRNGEHAPVYWCFARNTIEERVAEILLGKLESMNTLRGDTTTFGAIYQEIAGATGV
jgi:SNF2 family DNA or RNA helicase